MTETRNPQPVSPTVQCKQHKARRLQAYLPRYLLALYLVPSSLAQRPRTNDNRPPPVSGADQGALGGGRKPLLDLGCDRPALFHPPQENGTIITDWK